MLLYILTFNDYIIAFRTEPKLMSMNNVKEQKGTWTDQSNVPKLTSIAAYSVDLFDRIPIRFILNHVESYQSGNAYKSIYSDLLALSANLYPELFDIQSFLIQEGRDTTADSLWQIKTVYRDWKKNLTTTELEQLLGQWETNVSTVVDGTSMISDNRTWCLCHTSIILFRNNCHCPCAGSCSVHVVYIGAALFRWKARYPNCRSADIDVGDIQPNHPSYTMDNDYQPLDVRVWPTLDASVILLLKSTPNVEPTQWTTWSKIHI